MQFRTVTLSLFAALAAADHISDLAAQIPSCAQPCVASSVQKAGCGATDYKCQCGKILDITSSSALCVTTICGPDGLAGTYKTTAQLCLAIAGQEGSDALSSAADSLTSMVVGGFTSLTAAAASEFTSVTGAAASEFTRVTGGAASEFTSLTGAAASEFTSLTGGAGSAITSLTGGVVSEFTSVTGAAGSEFTSVTGGAGSAFTSITGGAGSAIPTQTGGTPSTGAPATPAASTPAAANRALAVSMGMVGAAAIFVLAL